MSFWDNMTKPKPLVAVQDGKQEKLTGKNLRIWEKDALKRSIKMLKHEVSMLKKENHKLKHKLLTAGVTSNDGLDFILECVAKQYKFTPAALASPSRATDYRTARIVFVILGKSNGYSFQKIGVALGLRSHSTIISMYNKSTTYLTKEDFAFIQSF